MVTQYAEFILKDRWLVVITSILLVLAAAAGMKNFYIEDNYRIFFDEDNPQLLAFESMQNNYDKTDNVLVVLTPANGNVFTRDNLALVEWITDQAWQTPYSKRVDSITNYQHTVSEQDDLLVAPLVEDAESLSARDLKLIKEVALSEPQLFRRLISPDGRVTAVNISINLPEDALEASPEIVSFVRDLKQQIQVRAPDMQVALTGVIMMNNAFSEASQQDMATLTPAMFLTVLVVLTLMLRSVSATMATLAVIMMSIMVGLGLFFWTGRPMSSPMASAPTIILTMAVADAVHLLSNFLWGMRGGLDKREAMIESLRINFQPIFLTSITTALGFLSINFAEVPPLADMGNTVAIGVIAAFFLSVSFLPALVYILPVKVKPRQQQSQHPLLEGLSHFVIRNNRVLLWSVTAFALLFIALIPRNEINDEFVKYFAPSVDFRADSDYASDNLVGPYTIEYSFLSGEDNGIADPAYLAQIKSFVDHVKTNEAVRHVYTLTDTMQRLNKNLHSDEEQWYKLPDNRELSAQYLLLYEMSLPYGLDLNDQLNMAKSSTRVIVSVENMSSNDMIQLEAEWKQWIEQNIPEFSFNAASTALMFAHIGQRNASSLVKGTILALILISAILIIALRSVKLGLLSLIPNLVPIGIAFGLWGLFDGMVGMSLSVVAGVTMGIVVDDTVHFLSKYTRAYREKNYSVEEAITYAFTTVGQALVVTTIVLVAGFMILTLSTFKFNADMGLLTAVTITLALIIDFLLLPPLLMLVDKNQKEKNHETQASVSDKPVQSTTV